jgi:predicted ArsR family transcriptional regulator
MTMPDLEGWRCRHTSLVFACRTIRDRFGEEAVDLVAGQHMKNVREAFRRQAAETGRNDMAALAERMTAPSESHTQEVIRQDDRVLEIKVTRCAHAEIFAEMNARDVGLKFMCAGDEAMIAGFNPQIELERPKVMMRGDDCCHFIYRLRD